MGLDEQQLRIEGVYLQNDRGEFMQRVKLAGGVLSLEQARALAELSSRFGSGTLHLSTRGSVEFHNLPAEDLPAVFNGLAAVGLFSRGACGGAVRGISCSSSFGPGFSRTQVMLRHFLHHFSGNPYFEGLPKKFKIAFEAGYGRSRHLIQDLALVLVEEDGEDSRYDVWTAGGLGREPQAGFLYATRVPEADLLPLAESIVEVYRAWGEKGRRLKHLLNAVGEDELRRRIEERRQNKQAVRFRDAFSKELLPDSRHQRLRVNVFAGELSAKKLAELVGFASQHECRWLLITPDQNIEMLVIGSGDALKQALINAGFDLVTNEGGALRVCPGKPECRMGLCATRDLAQRIRDEFGPQAACRSLAVSGCRNSCAQPQLAEFGILASKLKRDGDLRLPLFDIYRRSGEGLGQRDETELTEKELFKELGKFFQE